MGTPEGKVKTFIDARMKKWFPEAIKYAPPGNRFGRSGFPDRIWWIKATDEISVTVAVEAKALGENPSDLQMRTLVRMWDQGILATVIRGKDEKRMGELRDEILRRIRMANEGPKQATI